MIVDTSAVAAILLGEPDAGRYIELVPVTGEQVEAARAVWRRFGKGNHPANLNYGDCFAYALADTTDEPLLYKGDDFALTDITPALPPR